MDLESMEHRKVRVGLVQNAVSPDADENLKRTHRLARRAARHGAGIICLQELFRTPYFPQEEEGDASGYAETIPGESTACFAALAAATCEPFKRRGVMRELSHSTAAITFHSIFDHDYHPKR